MGRGYAIALAVVWRRWNAVTHASFLKLLFRMLPSAAVDHRPLALPNQCAVSATAQVLPTVGLNLAHFEALGAPLLCWDVGGAAGLRGIWSK